MAGVRAREPRALGRAISTMERLDDSARALVAALHPDAGNAVRVGLTGPPGVGKSTLASALVRHLRAEGTRVGVVSVDPTSPFTRGAVLGDRIRLAEHFLDPGVFIRSMASRGHAGGLAEATADATLVLDAAGFEVVLVETVGVGQGEVEVQSLAETVVLTLMPGSGDAVQGIKAGVMEIPDLIAITKADLPGASGMRSDLRAVLPHPPEGGWAPPVVTVHAREELGAGSVAGLWDEVMRHRAHLAEGGRLQERRREGLERQLRGLALERLGRRIDAATGGGEGLDDVIDEVLTRRLDPASAVDAVLARAGLA